MVKRQAKPFRTGMRLDSGFDLGARVFLIFVAPSGNGRNDLDPWAVSVIPPLDWARPASVTVVVTPRIHSWFENRGRSRFL
jgi:hypothetical protein